MYIWEREELQSKIVQTEIAISEEKLKKLRKTPRQQAVKLASENATLTDALLNGSLVKWFFVLFMLTGTVVLFQQNENRWLNISEDENNIQTIEFNEDAYTIDYMTYANIGSSMIASFEGITTVFDDASDVLYTVGETVENIGEFFGGENWFWNGVQRFRRWYGAILPWNW